MAYAFNRFTPHELTPEQQFSVFFSQEIGDPYKKVTGAGMAQSYRQALKEAVLQPLMETPQAGMFRNYVPDDYPDLTYNYYRVVQFPTCLTSIIERLSSTSVVAFNYVGDCI